MCCLLTKPSETSTHCELLATEKTGIYYLLLASLPTYRCTFVYTSLCLPPLSLSPSYLLYIYLPPSLRLSLPPSPPSLPSLSLPPSLPPSSLPPPPLTRYPDATEEELQTANTVCIICREDMVQRCKKLPCKHIFHTTCLRSWFQRQQVCPTCRYIKIHVQIYVYIHVRTLYNAKSTCICTYIHCTCTQ